MTGTTDTAAVKAATGAADAPAPRPAPRTARLWRGATPWLFLLAPLALLIVFTYAPIANMVAYSFTDWDGVSPELHYTGAENYAELFTRSDLFEVFRVSGYYLAASVFQIVAALYFATILSFNVQPDPTVLQVTVWLLYLIPTLALFLAPVGFAS
ncbi:hypothetical protein ABZZ80_14525, partial [Streptomyces sp. NPDC006356]